MPVAGGGEIGELAEAFREMTRKREARHRYILGFAADVAHELKLPPTSIRGAAELLTEGAADDLHAPSLPSATSRSTQRGSKPRQGTRFCMRLSARSV